MWGMNRATGRQLFALFSIWLGKGNCTCRILTGTGHLVLPLVRQQYIGPWLQLAQASIDIRVGVLKRPRDLLLAILPNLGDGVDYRVRAGAEELLLRVSVDLGDWNEATQAWGRHKRVLERHQHVRSVYERDLHREPRRQLRDRIGVAALRNAYLSRAVA